MNRFLFSLSLLSGLLVVANGAVVPALGNEPLATEHLPLQIKEPQVHEGMVVSATVDQVSMKTANGKDQTFKANAMTRVIVNGKPGKLTDLEPGMQIRVMVDQVGKVTSIATVDDRK